MQVPFNIVKAEGTLHPAGHRIGVHSGRTMILSVLPAPDTPGRFRLFLSPAKDISGRFHNQVN
jgi:hypothetical protein